jgi:plasmid maintenance system antidote protein VapI
MSKAALNTEPRQVTPHALIDHLLIENKLRNDAALSRALEVAPPVISKIRNFRQPLGPALRLRIMRKFGTPLAMLDELAPEAA